MERVSTNLTLFYRIFVPVFWIVFFGSVTVAVWAISSNSLSLQLGMTFFFLTGAATLFFTLMRLKRVEMGDEFVYVTNYFKTFRYPYSNIESVEVSQFLFVRVASINLVQGGYFGKRLLFIPSGRRLEAFFDAHPEHGKLFVSGK